MRAKTIILLSTASALALPSAAFACDMEGPGSRFSAFAHMMANPDTAPPQPNPAPSTTAPASYSDDSRAKTTEPTPVDYNTPPSTTPAADTKPSDEAMTR